MSRLEGHLAEVLALIRAVWNHPHPLAPSPIKGENHPHPLAPSPIKGENHPHPLAPSPIKGEGEPDNAALTPSPLVGEGAGGEGEMPQQRHIKFRDLWGVTKWQQLVESQDQDGKSLYQEVKPAIALGLPLKPGKFEGT